MTTGRKDSKPQRMDLLPPDALMAVSEVFASCGGSMLPGGEIVDPRYEDRNWEKGYDWGLTLGALLRHTMQFMAGEDVNDSGQLHAAHIAWHALVLTAFQLRGIGTDTRNKLDRVPGAESPARPPAAPPEKEAAHE